MLATIMLAGLLTSPMQATMSAYEWATLTGYMPIEVRCVPKDMIRVPCTVVTVARDFHITCTSKECKPDRGR